MIRSSVNRFFISNRLNGELRFYSLLLPNSGVTSVDSNRLNRHGIGSSGSKFPSGTSATYAGGGVHPID